LFTESVQSSGCIFIQSLRAHVRARAHARVRVRVRVRVCVGVCVCVCVRARACIIRGLHCTVHYTHTNKDWINMQPLDQTGSVYNISY
jgi:hypothetical protein